MFLSIMVYYRILNIVPGARFLFLSDFIVPTLKVIHIHSSAYLLVYSFTHCLRDIY